MAHYELHAWCLLVLAWVMIPFYSRSMVFTMPEFLEKRFNATARWVLSMISLVAYVLTKFAVGIFAGGVVFQTLLPELQVDVGFMVLQQFLDRLGGRHRPHRRVHGVGRHAGRGVQRRHSDRDPGHRFGPGHGLRAEGTGRLGPVCAKSAARRCSISGSRSFRPGWKGRGSQSKNRAASPGTSTAIIPGWECCSVPRSSACGTGVRTSISCSGPGRAERAAGPPRQHLRRVSQTAARIHLHHSGHDLLRLGQVRTGGGVPWAGGRERQADRGTLSSGLPADGQARVAGRRAGACGRRAVVGFDEFPGRCAERQFHAVHDRLLPEASTRGLRSTNWSGSDASPRR